MSTSRLEKFIYAICSMEVTDLPVPLSRIETLWNCLITGETPDFEPLSRNEKYLMAMLDRYDISNLPAPMSRGEKLLYRIAVGETDLSDVPGYLSRYEELLKNLIENGGISGGDFEYVLYTLNQSMYTLYTTAEKPVKRAILKGQTLVNIDSYYDRNDFYTYGADSIDKDGYIQLTAKGIWVNAHTRNNSLVKPNTKYAIIVDIKENTLDPSISNALKICTNTDTLDSVWSDINGIDIAGGVTGRLFFTATTSNEVSSIKMLQRAYIGSALKTGHIKYRWMIIEYQKGMENWDIPYFRGMTSVKMPVLTISNEDDTKTNILTVNEDVTLRGIGDVKDELNCLTGELTHRIGEIILNGSENWVTRNGGTSYAYIINNFFSYNNVEGIANSFKFIKGGSMSTQTQESICSATRQTALSLFTNKDELSTVNKLKTYLSQNPVTIQYKLEEESTKTVDLTIVDQDNQPTQLGTFENITHVSLEAENLIPEVEMEVATHISTELASASPLMDDISTEQQQLETTVNEQSNNVDATMIAITEIFEETL